MNQHVLIPALEKKIKFQLITIRYCKIFGPGLFIWGVIIIVLSFFYPKSLPEGFDTTLLRLGGAFISSLCSLLWKEILRRKEIISSCEIAIYGILHSKSDDELKKSEEFGWKTLEK